MRATLLRATLGIVVTVVAGGCAARKPATTSRLQPPGIVNVTPGKSAPTMSLQSYMARVRQASLNAKAPERPMPTHTEATNSRLATAVRAAEAQPSPATLRAAAEEYRRLGILDRAHDYLQRALALDSRDGATHETIARVWRDGGLAGRALADAYRALYYAPASPSAHNTLGTVFQALGRRNDARREYERALQIDPNAAYALNNLCYCWILERQPQKAEAACDAALKVQPTLRAARNNLALAYAAQGDLPAAQAALAIATDPATAQYNLGILQMGRRKYSDAVSAFIAAQQARPAWRLAADRAAQAAKLASSRPAYSGAEE